MSGTKGKLLDVGTAQRPRRSASLSSASSRVLEGLDRAIAWLLRVEPQSSAAPRALATTGGRPFETPLLIAGVRCILRYVVLPFALPLVVVVTGATLGLVTGAALVALLTLDVVATIAIVATLRRLWRFQHPRRWQYLPVAVALVVLVGFFFVNDARVLYR